ncbi:MAG: formylglycine-generating enzyme family protein [Planctomycetia bacterium]|nr:formylglycine-generating enzyme family protein [Planctomycetia bacterium]
MTNLNRRFAILTATLLFLAGTTLTGSAPPSSDPSPKKQDGIPNVVVSDEIPVEQRQKPVRELPQDYLNANGQEFRLIPAGSFMMGNLMTPEEIHEKYPGGEIEWYRDAPSHKVTISKPFYMSKYETTVADFRKFVEATGYKTDAEQKGNARGFDYEANQFTDIDGLNWKNPGFEQSSVHPVVCVSWNDAQAYLDWMNEKAEFDSELGFKPFYRLPTEAEWEYACRAGSRTEFFWGNEPKDGKGYLNAADESGAPNGNKWSYSFPFNDGYVTTAPVGSFKPNAWGLYDMHGNVWEWCLDWYDKDYYEESPSVDPLNTTSSSGRVSRSGGWNSYAGYCRSALRYFSDPSSRYSHLGFRFLLSSSSK